MNIFNRPIKVGGIPRNKFDLSHERKLTLNLGKLVPILCQEVVPGDVFRVNTEIFLRMAPMIAPIMHRVDIYTHYFYVPNRIIWDGWDEFISKEGPGVPVKVPQFVVNPLASYSGPSLKNGSLADYLGFPTYANSWTAVLQAVEFSQLPFRAYTTIYNEYYRDQTLSQEIVVPTGDADVVLADPLGGDEPEWMKLRIRSYEKDYFTTAMPNPQYGAQAAAAPLNGPLRFAAVYPSGGVPPAGDIKTQAGTGLLQDSVSGSIEIMAENVAGTAMAPGTLIEDIRRANTLQLWLEKQARGGQRLVETVLSHFGVRVPDERVSRPEYLGGGKQHISISEVLSTYDNTANDFPQGTMAGHGVSSGRSHGFKRQFPEHGYVIGIMSVLPKTAYQQGFNRHWIRKDKFDFYWPVFAHLGEQEIKNREIFYKGDMVGNPDGTFGYQMRYSEYKYAPDTVHGDFRANLAYWHMGRIFANEPQLNEQFIQARNEDFDRVFAVTDPDTHKLWCQIYNSIDALRPMPVFSTPSL